MQIRRAMRLLKQTIFFHTPGPINHVIWSPNRRTKQWQLRSPSAIPSGNHTARAAFSPNRRRGLGCFPACGNGKAVHELRERGPGGSFLLGRERKKASGPESCCPRTSTFRSPTRGAGASSAVGTVSWCPAPVGRVRNYSRWRWRRARSRRRPARPQKSKPSIQKPPSHHVLLD